jgi:hypothetical protein
LRAINPRETGESIEWQLGISTLRKDWRKLPRINPPITGLPTDSARHKETAQRFHGLRFYALQSLRIEGKSELFFAHGDGLKKQVDEWNPENKKTQDYAKRKAWSLLEFPNDPAKVESKAGRVANDAPRMQRDAVRWWIGFHARK